MCHNNVFPMACIDTWQPRCVSYKLTEDIKETDVRSVPA